MSRLPYIRHYALNAEAQAVWDGIVGSRARGGEPVAGFGVTAHLR